MVMQNVIYLAYEMLTLKSKAMSAAARFEGNTSKANGSLMRSTPIGVFGYKLTTDEIALIAKEDSKLSHPNSSVCDAVACYSIAIANLIANGDAK